jgi:hypothetical protein
VTESAADARPAPASDAWSSIDGICGGGGGSCTIASSCDGPSLLNPISLLPVSLDAPANTKLASMPMSSSSSWSSS